MPRASFVEDEEANQQVPVDLSDGLIAVSDIHDDPVTDVRSANDSQQSIQEFAEQIKREGLAVPITVRPRSIGSGGYSIIAGRRRLRAVQLNTNYTGFIPAHVLVVDDATARRLAFEENHRRKQFSPIDYARLFLEARGDKFLPNWSERVSKQFGVSRATVTETIKMYEGLAGDQELIDQVHAGTLAADAAILLAKTKSEEREAQLEAARALATAEEAARPAKKAKKPASEPAEGKKDSPAPAKVKAKHVRAAAQAAGQPVMGILKRDELIAGLQHLIVPEAPAAMNGFLDYCTTTWASGKGTMMELERRWQQLIPDNVTVPAQVMINKAVDKMYAKAAARVSKAKVTITVTKKKATTPPAKKSAKVTKPAKPAKSRKK